MIKKIGNGITLSVLTVLQCLGEAVIAVIIHIVKNFWELLGLVVKYVWDKSVKLRTKVLNILQYIGFFVASPAVKLWISLSNIKRDIKSQKKQKGFFSAALSLFVYFIKFVFGKKGVAVTAFNYAAPILSVVFLFNVVSYATSSTFALKLTVNGQFIGYVENEQVFLDAEALVLQRVNYFLSSNTIETVPEFSIERIGVNETLTKFQVANLILKNSDFNLEYAYGFYIDGNFWGAVTDEDYPLIKQTMSQLLDSYRSSDPDEEIGFLNNVEWDKYDLYLAESIIEPQEIINTITSTRVAASYYIVEEGDSHSLICDKMDMTIDEIESLNPGFGEQSLRAGDRIKKNVDEPYLPITVTRTVEYEEVVPFKTEYRDDDSYYINVSNVKQQGVDGLNHVVARVSYVNGVEINRVPTEVTVVTEPVAKIVHNGTKTLPSGQVSTQSVEYGMFIWPTTGGYVSCGYGWDAQLRRQHNAVDIAGIAYGAPVFAGANGTVVLARYDYQSYGHTVIIQHENGLRTLYAHNSALVVKEGDVVTQGQQIANAGSTGYSFGTHVHFEVRSGNTMLNPINYLPYG